MIFKLFVVFRLSSSAHSLSFLSEPVSLVQSRGSVARLRCSASPPSAVLSWRFRGHPLDKAMPPGLEITEDSLTISSLNSEHVGAYQCVARLDRGLAIASHPAHIAIAGTNAEHEPCVCLRCNQSSNVKKWSLNRHLSSCLLILMSIELCCVL